MRTKPRDQAPCATSRTAGLKGVQLFIADKCFGLIESVAECYLQAAYRRCAVAAPTQSFKF